VRTRPHWAGELLVLAFLLVIYDQIAGEAATRATVAIRHGRDLLALSPDGFEKAADHWLAGVGWLRDPASLYYDLAHINVTLVVFVSCYVWAPRAYRRARTSLVVVNLIGLVVFLLYPVAPPRLLPGAGFIDIVGLSGTFQSGDATIQHSNAYGSLPSLHAAWAFWVGLVVFQMTTRTWLRALAWAHGVLTCLVVIITAAIAVAWAFASQVVHRNSSGLPEPAVTESSHA
jgi:hypothetical protein